MKKHNASKTERKLPAGGKRMSISEPFQALQTGKYGNIVSWVYGTMHVWKSYIDLETAQKQLKDPAILEEIYQKHIDAEHLYRQRQKMNEHFKLTGEEIKRENNKVRKESKEEYEKWKADFKEAFEE